MKALDIIARPPLAVNPSTVPSTAPAPPPLPNDFAAAHARGLWLIPLDPDTKTPAIHRKGHPINEGRRRLSDREFAHYRALGCNFGVMLDPSGLAVVDVEADGDAGPWAAHVEGGGPNVIRTWSGGFHAYYSRPAGTPARRVIHRGGLAVDVLAAGYVVLAGSVVNGARYAAPAEFWDVPFPMAPADVLAALALPEPPAPSDPPTCVPGLQGLTSVAPGRAEAFVVGLVERRARRIGAMRPAPAGQPGSGRRRVLYAAARTAGEFLHHAPHLEAWVIQALTEAAHVCLLVETDREGPALENIANGLRKGKANPRDIPNRANRTPATTSTSSGKPADPSEVERVQAAALAMLANLGARVRRLVDDDGKPIHCRTARTVDLVAGELLRRMADTGAPVIEAVEALGLTIDRGGASVWRAFPWLVRLGLDVKTGVQAGKDEPRASRFTLSTALLCQFEMATIAAPQTTDSRQRPGNAQPETVPFKLTEEEIEHAAVTLRTVEAAGEDLSRGLRRALDDAALQELATRENPTLKPTGDYTPAALAAVQAAGDDGLTYAELAAALGCSESTARRIGPRMVGRGAWIERARLSAAGRRLVVFVSAVVVTRILEIVKAVGARARRWAERKIEAGREILRKAWRLVTEGYFMTVGAALLVLRRRARERAKAEWAAVAPGGERGRPGWDREGAGRALANAAAWVRHNAETAGVMS